MDFLLRDCPRVAFPRPIMMLARREFLQLGLYAAAVPSFCGAARAQAYPSRPVRILVGFAPAGAVDITARLLTQSLSEQLGQPFTVENRPGAGTNLATEAAVRAAPDGYTLVMISAPAAINATLYEKLNFNFVRDIAPIASAIKMPFVLLANPSIPAKTVPELIALAKANPGKITMASSGNGSGLHLCGEMFKMMAGVDLVHVPYRGEALAITDLIAGQVQTMFGTTAVANEHIKAGKVRALALTTAMDGSTDIPVMSEFLPGYDASFWAGVGAPRATPPDVIEKLSRQINQTLADPKIKARFADLGGAVLAGSPVDFGKLIADETEKWGKVIRAAHIRPE
jgi:tripartite-type tricarboxylate transporter receptor subunit TctC